MRQSVVVLLAFVAVASALKCYKGSAQSEGPRGDEMEVACECGNYCVKYFAEIPAKDQHVNRQVTDHDDGKIVRAHERVQTDGKRAASWDCGCTRQGGFQQDMCKEKGKGVFGSDPQLEVTCCEGDLCNSATSIGFSLLSASIVSLVLYFH